VAWTLSIITPRNRPAPLRAPRRMKIGVRTRCMRMFEIATPSTQPPSTISIAMPAIMRAFRGTSSL